MTKLLDANVWLALCFSDHVHHPVAHRWFNAQPDGSCAFCRVTQLALLRHLTNSRIMRGFVLTQQNAWLAFDALLSDPRVIFSPEPANLDGEFRRLTDATSPSHETWTDTYLVAFAAATNMQLATFDQRLASLGRINVLVLAP